MARKTNRHPQKIVQHVCLECGFKNEPAILRRAQDRKCPKCEYWGVKMMVAKTLAYKAAQFGEISHFIRFQHRENMIQPGLFSDTVKVHADVDAYCLWKIKRTD